jgi:hypothetical protein
MSSKAISSCHAKLKLSSLTLCGISVIVQKNFLRDCIFCGISFTLEIVKKLIKIKKSESTMKESIEPDYLHRDYVSKYIFVCVSV